MSSRLSQNSIRVFFKTLPDPKLRRKRIKHPLLNLVAMALCGILAGADGWEEIEQFAVDRREWLSRFLDCRTAFSRMTPWLVCSRPSIPWRFKNACWPGCKVCTK